jgi:hypothetical protein
LGRAGISLAAKDFRASIVQPVNPIHVREAQTKNFRKERVDVRSAEGIPPALSNDSTAPEIDKPASSSRAENDVLILDISMAYVPSMQKRQAIGYLTKVTAHKRRREADWVQLDQIEEV